MVSALTAAVRAAATNPEPAVFARLEAFLRAGADVDPGEDPVLVEAVYRRYSHVVLPVLLQAGADPGRPRADGLTALDIAAGRNNALAVEILLWHSAGAELDGPRIMHVSADKYLIRGCPEFYRVVARMLKCGHTCHRSPALENNYGGWDDGEAVTLTERLLEKSMPSSFWADQRVLVVEADELYLIDVALNECIGAVDEDLVSRLDGVAEELAALELTR